MSITSHDTTQMRDWSTTMDNNASDYDSLINRLYALIDEFVGSEKFKGGLSADFGEKVLSQRSTFMRYSDTFREPVSGPEGAQRPLGRRSDAGPKGTQAPMGP